MQTNQTTVIQTVGLTKAFRDFWYRRRVVAVDRLDLDVYQNEVFGLLGPNGSGKSTTIKMLLGLLYPTRGRIRVLGHPPTDVAIKSRIGYLPEESYLYRFLNAHETLDYYGRLFQIPRAPIATGASQLLEMVGLQREAKRRVGEYSKGMARRIGLAQALINDPDLLILDEPTTGLDPIGTREMKDLILFLNREKRKTILLCSHLLADVEDVCQRVTILYGGRRQAMGNVHELLSRENLTQITTERISDKAVSRIREIVEQDEGKQFLNVSSPSDKLETFFLRIVRQAQESRQQTSGVTAGGQIADFLTGSPDQGEALVQSLIAASTQNSTERAQTETRPVAIEPDSNLISELVSTATRATDEAREEPPAPAIQEQMDSGVIDDLMKHPDGHADGHRE